LMLPHPPDDGAGWRPSPLFSRLTKIVAPVSRPAVLRATRPSVASPILQPLQ
jgi:hypothetical protein